MKYVRRTIIVLTVLVVISGVALFVLMEPLVQKAVREAIARLEIPEPWDLTVRDIRYYPPGTIGLSGVTFTSADTEESAHIALLTARLDVSEFLANKRMLLKLSLEDMEGFGISSDAKIMVRSTEAPSYKEALDAAKIRQILIERADLSYGELEFQELQGSIMLDELRPERADLRFHFLGKEASLAIKSLEKASNSFSAELEYPDISAAIRLKFDDEAVHLEDLSANIYHIATEFSGSVERAFTEKPEGHFRGSVKADLREVLHALNPEGPSPPQVEGKLDSNIHILFTAFDIKALEIESATLIKDLKIENFSVGQLNLRSKFHNGILSVPEIRGALYGGLLQGKMDADPLSEARTFDLDLQIADVRFGEMFNELMETRTRVTGKLDGILAISGHLKYPPSISGKGTLYAYEANLGPMPILAPLVGNLYGILQRAFPVAEDLNIREAYTEFQIRNEKVTTEKLLFSSRHVLIEGEGWVGFDGTLDLAFENQLQEPEDLKTTDPLRRALEGLFVHFGKILSKAHLRGTIQEPRWEFEYLDPLTGTLDRGIRGILNMF